MYVIKKDNTHEPWNVQKVVVAVNKSAYRALVKFTQEELDFMGTDRGLIRLYCGLEGEENLLEDLETALKKL